MYSVISDYTKPCRITDCSCLCHSGDESCGIEKCDCGCHEIEVEMEVLEALKLQQLEEGYPSDEEEIECPVKGEEKPDEGSSSTPEVFSPKSPKEFLFERSEKLASDSESLLETIHEVPSVEEKEEARSHGATSVIKPDEKSVDVEKKSPPKLADIGHQVSISTTPKLRPKLSKLKSEVSVDDIMPGIGDLDDVKLIVSGKSYNIKPRRPFYSDGFNMYDKLDRSLPSYKGSITPTYKKQRPSLLRSKTVDAANIQPRSFKDIHDERLKKQEKMDKKKEKKREHAHGVIDDMSSVVSLTADDIAVLNDMPGYLPEDTFDVLCTSANVPQGLADITKKGADEHKKDRAKKVTINMSA